MNKYIRITIVNVKHIIDTFTVYLILIFLFSISVYLVKN